MKRILIFGASAVPFIALAHPGHGETEGFSIIHYFTEPMHVIVTVGAVVALYAGYRFFRRKSEKG